MQILIHGRKNGYNVLYPKPTPKEFYSYASDIQSISATNHNLYYGKYFYVLAFAKGGCIFTKYVIGNDIERGQLGEIGISIFIPNNNILSGENILFLLDELINLYYKNYLTNNYKIEEPYNGFNWELFTTVADSYDTKLSPQVYYEDIITAGTLEPAFHYYKTKKELIDHFDKPYQEVYSAYKQIFFIDYNLKDTANPLDILRNSGHEINPDLNNEFYYLNNYNQSKGITIIANGTPLTDQTKNIIIRSNWLLEIKYVKEHYYPITEIDSLSNPYSRISKYFEIIGNQINILYDKFAPDPIIYIYKIKVVDRKKNNIDKPKIICTSVLSNTDKIVSNNKIEFLGPEIKTPWTLKATYNDSFGSRSFTPENENINEPVLITIEERNTINIVVKDERGIEVTDFQVKTKLTKGYQKTKSISFVDEQITDSYNVFIRKNGFKKYIEKDFRPYRANSLNVTLLKKNNNFSFLKGNQINLNPPISNNVFTKFKTLLTNPYIFVTIIVSIIAFIGISIFSYLYLNKNQQSHELLPNSQEINYYLQGDTINLETLKDYLDKWKLQESAFIVKSGGGLFGGSETTDSTKWKNDWKPILESIKHAIEKRNYINNKYFHELKRQKYYQSQLNFKNAIERIDSSQYHEVQNKLGDVSTLTLTQIAIKINQIINLKDTSNQELNAHPKEKESKVERQKQTDKLDEIPKTKPYRQEQNPSSSDFSNEIITYLKGSELDKAKLQEYKNMQKFDPNLENSIQLCLDFWHIDGRKYGKNNNTYCFLKERVNKDNYLKNSNLLNCLINMCQQEQENEGINPYSDQNRRNELRKINKK